MKDDYLWDATGEPDPDVEQLEELLGRFRHQGRAPEIPVAPRRFFWPRMAAAAALIVVALAGLWIVLHRETSPIPNSDQMADSATESGESPKSPQAQATEERVEPVKEPFNAIKSTRPSGPIAREKARKAERRREAAPGKAVEEPSFSSTVALVDHDTASYLESAQMLLRSFRNISVEQGDEDLDVSYEKERSRELLYKNILLRRDAEVKGNLPVNHLLSGVEPVLLDIANLPAIATRSDVRSIQERIEKKEIIATIQVYSAPILGANFKQR